MSLQWKGQSGLRLGVAAFTCAWLLVAGAAMGQSGRMRTPTVAGRGFGGLSRVGEVGNTSVSRYFQQSSPGAGMGGMPRGTRNPNQNLAPMGGRRMGGRQRDLLSLTPARVRANRLPEHWRQTLAQSGAARWFADPPSFQAFQLGINRGGGAAAQLLLSPERLVRTTAFSAPAGYGGIGVGVARDPLPGGGEPALTLGPAEPVSEFGRKTQAEMMDVRFTAMRKRSLDDAWSWFQRGEFQRARSCFKNVEMLDPSSSEPRAGTFFCLIAERRHAQALHAATRLYRLDSGPRLFDPDYQLQNRYARAEIEDPVERGKDARLRLVEDVQAFLNFAGTNPNSVALAAEAYALWHSDHETEAVQAARVLKQRDPGGSFGMLATRLLDAAARRAEEVPEDVAGGVAPKP